MDNFGLSIHKADATISHLEWFEYHMDLAMAIPNDEYFIRNLLYKWRMQENSEMTALSDKVKQLIAMVRQRLLMLSNHSEEEYQLRKIFNSFDLNLSGSITIDELSAMLAKLGIL